MGNPKFSAAPQTLAPRSTPDPDFNSAMSTENEMAEAPPEQQLERKESFLDRLWNKLNPTLVLENQGSVARDHLASERTFLAYVRTSLVIASTGVALVQLFSIATTTNTDESTDFTDHNDHIAKYAKPLGATTTGFGLVVLGLGLYRYFSIQKALLVGMFPVTRYGLMLMTFLLSSMVVIVFAVLVAENRSS